MTKMRKLEERIVAFQNKKNALLKKQDRLIERLGAINTKLQRLFNKQAIEQGKAPQKVAPIEPANVPAL